MGQWISSLIEQFSQKELDICICGVAGAGKSCLCKALTSYTRNETPQQHWFRSVKPTLSMELGHFQWGKVKGCIRDISGQMDAQQAWKLYISSMDRGGVAIFVIDVADRDTFDIAKRRLYAFLDHVKEVRERSLENSSFRDLKVLIVYNKIDLPNHATAEEMEQILAYNDAGYQDLQIVTKETSAIEWRGIPDVLEFLVNV